MKRALEQKPENAKVWFEAGCLAEELCHYDQARQFLAKALELEPTNTEIHNKLSEILYSLKRYEEAVNYLEKAIVILRECQPDKKHCLSILLGNLGMTYASMGENEKAYTILQESVQ
jgi:tetratricopeptide (TPR) repeat protein